MDTAWRCKSTLNLYEVNDVEAEVKASEAVRTTSEGATHATDGQSSHTPPPPRLIVNTNS